MKIHFLRSPVGSAQLRNDANAYCHWRNASLPTEAMGKTARNTAVVYTPPLTKRMDPSKLHLMHLDAVGYWIQNDPRLLYSQVTYDLPTWATCFFSGVRTPSTAAREPHQIQGNERFLEEKAEARPPRFRVPWSSIVHGSRSMFPFLPLLTLVSR